MDIAADLKTKLNNNQHYLFITETDELLAAWQFKRKSSSKRSMDLSNVPKEWRYSTPPNDKDPLMPCHVTLRRKLGQNFSKVEPAYEYTTRSCHHNLGSVPDLTALEAIDFTKRNVSPWISPFVDAYTLSLVLKDLGINGRAIPKVINGRQYIAFSGYPGLRTHFPGTLYSAKNRKIINMAIGSLGIKNMVKSGGVITLCVTVPLTIVEAFLKDHSSCYELLGNIAADLIKIGIPALIGAILGLATGTVTTVAFFPIAVTILITGLTGYAFNKIDKNYQLTEKLIAALENFGKNFTEHLEQMQKSIGRAPHQIEREIIWRTFRIDTDNPLRF